MNFCPKCGAHLAGISNNTMVCHSCGFPISNTAGPSLPNSLQPDPSEKLPWEKIGSLGLVHGFIDTLTESLLQPKRFFTRLGSAGHSPFLAILFAIIICSLSQMVMLGISSIIPSSWNNLFLSIFDSGDFHKNDPGVELVFLPFITVATMLVAALYFHLCTVVFGVKNRSLSTTFIMLCYLQSTSIAIILPVIGPLVVLVWWLILSVKAFRYTYGISTGRSLSLVIIPPVTLLFVLGMVVALILAIGLSGSSTDLLKEILTSIR